MLPSARKSRPTYAHTSETLSNGVNDIKFGRFGQRLISTVTHEYSCEIFDNIMNACGNPD